MTIRLITGDTVALFDLDGVLIDSEREYSRIWATINREFPTGVEELEKIIKGCTLDKILTDYFPDPELQKRVIKRLYDLEGMMNYEYLPGAEKLLKSLKEHDVHSAIVTSSNEDKMRHLYEELPGIKNYFDLIITADQITKSKPDPEGYLLGASKLGGEIKKSVVFEDSLQGVKAGRNSGAFVVGVAGTLDREVLEPYADIVVDSLEEVDVDKLLNELSTR